MQLAGEVPGPQLCLDFIHEDFALVDQRHVILRTISWCYLNSIVSLTPKKVVRDYFNFS